MKVLEKLPPFTGEWLDPVWTGMPSMEQHVLAAGSIRMSDGSWRRVVEKAYWVRYEEEDDPQWYIAGPDSYTLYSVTNFMVLPPLPEHSGTRAYLHQYTAETCPGRPCAQGCDHRGVPPEERYVIVSESEKGFWSNEIGWVRDKASATTYSLRELDVIILPITRGADAKSVTYLESRETFED